MPRSLPDRLLPPSAPAPSRRRVARLRARDRGWCVRANRWGARDAVRRYFAAISRLGDGVFWYVLMAALIVVDGVDGLAASAHLAATRVVALATNALVFVIVALVTPRTTPRAAIAQPA